MNTPCPFHELTAEAALTWVDNLLYSEKGHRLSDLERQIFIGSWRGQTYEEIYPLNPQYVEKSVGYKLWRKLSDVLAEKVSKKRVREAVIRRMNSYEELPILHLGLKPEWQHGRRIRITQHSPNPVAQQSYQLRVSLRQNRDNRKTGR
ncbi:hypothetical protein [Pseudanabaena sp. FACHB-2040]|uniref:hypothetical protein n=1 Tax=Pseudanabaena sp. FACHB-2040 TaxID=2692859 RepID=UPI001686B844|nr:hypothetical protein [Pseudanabaena sp. FACHB-2040]MBD2256145.1 hypothetical protein [Pseudanabaena sp. FACHB-2040]